MLPWIVVGIVGLTGASTVGYVRWQRRRDAGLDRVPREDQSGTIPAGPEQIDQLIGRFGREKVEQVDVPDPTQVQLEQYLIEARKLAQVKLEQYTINAKRQIEEDVKKSPTAAEFAQRYTAIYMRHGRCKDWRWGFSVDDLMEDATAAGGAAVVVSVMSWIKAYTGLSAILSLFNFVFTWPLWQYLLSPQGDGEGLTVYMAFSEWYPIDFEAPDVPLPPVEGYTRGWLKKKGADVYGMERVRELLLPKHKGGSWAWLAETSDLRTALREDKIDLSTIAKHQCKDGSWKMTTKTKAQKHYR